MENSIPATTSSRSARPNPDDRHSASTAAFLTLIVRLAVMGTAVGALLYRWKPGNAPLLILVMGFFVGFLVAFLRRRRNEG